MRGLVNSEQKFDFQEDCSFNNSVDMLLNVWLMSIIKSLEATTFNTQHVSSMPLCEEKDPFMAHNMDFIRNAHIVAHLARWRKVIRYLKSCPLSSEATSSMWTWSHSWEMKGKQICMRWIRYSRAKWCTVYRQVHPPPSLREWRWEWSIKKEGTGHHDPRRSGAFNTGG